MIRDGMCLSHIVMIFVTAEVFSSYNTKDAENRSVILETT